MTTGIKITADEMRYIALFESISGASVKDCIVDEERRRAIFIVNPGQVGVAIGKGGRNIHTLEKMTGKKHEIIEYSEDPAQFIKNALKPAAGQRSPHHRENRRQKNGSRNHQPQRQGRRNRQERQERRASALFAKRYFDIQNVSIT